MNLDTTISWDNPLWPALAAVLLLGASYIRNKSVPNQVTPEEKSKTLDHFLVLLSSTRVPFAASFVLFIMSNPTIKAQLQSIWDTFVGGKKEGGTQ